MELLDLVEKFAVIIALIPATCAVILTYIAIENQHKPNILVYYRVNPDVATLVDLVVENMGSGAAFNIKFTQPIVTHLFGIEKGDGEGKKVLKHKIPMLAAKQQIIMNGGQYGGISEHIKEELKVEFTYSYLSSFSCNRNKKGESYLTINHLESSPTKNSASTAIVKALSGNLGATTLHQIRDALRKIEQSLNQLSDK